MSQEKVAVVIPSRYASTRFPAKPLALLCGKPLVQHVYEKAAASKADLVLVATDHEAIRGAVESFGGRAVMTAEGSWQFGSMRISTFTVIPPLCPQYTLPLHPLSSPLGRMAAFPGPTAVFR